MAAAEGAIEHEEHARTRQIARPLADAIDAILEIAGHLPAFGPTAAFAADRAERFDDPRNRLVGNDQRFQSEFLEIRQRQGLFFQHNHQVGLQGHNGFEVRIVVAPDVAGLLDVLDFRRVVAIAGHAHYTTSKPQGVERFGDAGGHRDDPPALPTEGSLGIGRHVDSSLRHDTSGKDEEDCRNQRESVLHRPSA